MTIQYRIHKADGTEIPGGIPYGTREAAQADLDMLASVPGLSIVETAAHAALAKTRTITLTDRAPVKIREEEWPEIAGAKDWDNTHESQTNRRWQLRVRQNREDGRTIVYGTYSSQWQSERGLAAGELLDPPTGSVIDPEHWIVWDEIPAAIKRVAANCGCDRIADECIADLPAQEI